VSERTPDEEAQVDATDGWAAGAPADAMPAPSGEDLTAGTMFAPGLVPEATEEDARGPAEG
jgi:hypothetical protein